MVTLKELRQRRIVQIVVGYAAAGWIVLEAVSQFVERGVVPEFVYPLVLIWYVIGLAASGIIGWFHGERGDQKAPAAEIVLLCGLGFLGIGLSVPRTLAHLEERAALEAAAASRMDLQRVAVRYFDDLSPRGELEYLADGLTEELIGQLSGVRVLDVISPNGVQRFRSADIPSDSVARVLDAGTIVHGSLEPVGEAARITVRLIDGESGAEIRRTVVERPLAELLEIRDVVAEEVSRLLRDWLGQEIELRSRRTETENEMAWALVQRAERARKEMEAALREGDRELAEAAYARAEERLVQAETLDPDWTVPTTGRGWLAYRFAYRHANIGAHLPEVVGWLDRGMDLAERALDRAPTHPDALELRGSLRYLRWLLNVTPVPEERAALIEGARTDLERAVDLDPGRASAYSTLSHLYGQTDIAAMVLAARRSYEEDAYLEVADATLWRLFGGSLDLGQFTQAGRWCEEGARRFPGDPRFVVCQLRLMATPAREADVERAWELLAKYDSLTGTGHSEVQRIHAQMTVAGVLARGGLPDSARAVIRRAREESRPGIDPSEDLASWEAYVRTLLGDDDEAIALLRRYQAAHPGHTFDPSQDLGWWWRSLASHPDFADLGSPHPP